MSGEPLPQDARYNQEDDEIRGDRPYADVKGAER
jgi:hypothetical protein